ncbi:hypothetical protein B0H19DRAFT_144549 [Mycena capillaripes]|nr:hypothetical protein B0H19DRAFT_144549 [Mycena capillaripes]
MDSEATMLNNTIEADRTRLANIEIQILNIESELFLAALTAMLNDIETEIPHIDSEHSLFALRAEKAQVQERLNLYRSPVSTLPNELVVEIFIHFLPTYPLCPPLFGIDSPTSLTHICHEWREIALATPQLWGAIRLSKTDTSQLYPIVDIWLNRSLCPLSIHIETDYAWPELFSGFVPHRSRWEYLKLHCVRIPPAAAALPLLRHLELSGEGRYNFTFHDVPLLRSAALDNFTAETITLPWAQLTSLTLRDVHPSECLPVLKQTFNLVHCELCFWEDQLWANELPPTGAHDIMFPCLESLTLRNPDGMTLEDFLVILVVPALRSLRVPERLLGLDPISLLTSVISKSGCKLQEVSIQLVGQSTVSEDSYRSAFPSIPQLSFVEEL